MLLFNEEWVGRGAITFSFSFPLVFFGYKLHNMKQPNKYPVLAYAYHPKVDGVNYV